MKLPPPIISIIGTVFRPALFPSTLFCIDRFAFRALYGWSRDRWGIWLREMP